MVKREQEERSKLLVRAGAYWGRFKLPGGSSLWVRIVTTRIGSTQVFGCARLAQGYVGAGIAHKLSLIGWQGDIDGDGEPVRFIEGPGGLDALERIPVTRIGPSSTAGGPERTLADDLPGSY